MTAEPENIETTDNSVSEESIISKPTSLKKKVIYTSFCGFLLFLLAMSVFFYFNFKTIEVQGNSMEPKLHPTQRLLISKAYWLVGQIKKGDIVVIDNKFEGDTIIKRVYALEGEEVNYKNAPVTWDLTRGKYIVPEGTIYVLGDNRAVSEDSRHYGPFEIKDVIGKVVVVHSMIDSPGEASEE